MIKKKLFFHLIMIIFNCGYYPNIINYFLNQITFILDLLFKTIFKLRHFLNLFNLFFHFLFPYKKLLFLKLLLILYNLIL